MSEKLENAVRPGLLRILAAIFYDFWLIAAIWLIGTTLDAVIRNALMDHVGDGNYLVLQSYLLLSPWIFFAWFWMHGGQTLGMRSWRIKVVELNGDPISRIATIKRYLAALLSWLPLGLGFIWVLFDKENRSWHDLLSNTRLVMVQKRNKS